MMLVGKKMKLNFLSQRGFSVLEVLVASTILSVAVGGAVALQSTVMQRTTSVNDRTFAAQKATQMFEEMRSFVQANRESNITKLQNFTDGASFSPVLTTERKEVDTADGRFSEKLSNPDDPISGNMRLSPTAWKFVRQVQVDPVPNDENARYVKISVWLADHQNNQVPRGYDPESAAPPPKALASVAGILKTNITADPPAQVMDIFLIAMENAPSWWVDLADLRPSFERTLTDLEQRNPGLRYRRHYITRFGYGRDPYYLPYINDANTANAQVMPWSLLYPGRINHDIQHNYVLDQIRGRVRTDLNTRFAHVNTQHPEYDVSGFDPPGQVGYRHYPLADQFNQVMRWPEQLAMEKRLSAQDPYFARHPSLVNFLEDLNTPLDENGNPVQGGEMRYRNAMIVNLHGELVPLPAIRNYSDPAKQPDKVALKLNGNNTTSPPASAADHATLASTTDVNQDYISLRNKRVVTHPENLRADNASEVAWRVYAYEKYDPGETGLVDHTDNPTRTSAINVNHRAHPEIHSIPKTSLFIPTIGRGPRFDGLADSGFLRYPDFTPAVLNSNNNPLLIERIVGAYNVEYRRWSTDIARHQGRTQLSFITDTHDASCTPGPSNSDCLYPARQLGTLLAAPSAMSLTLAPSAQWSTRATGGVSTLNDLRDDLRNQLIVITNSTGDTRITRIDDVSLAGGITLHRSHGLTSPLPASWVGAVVTRFEDFKAEAVDETMLGHAQRGYRIMLYDTPTRHPRGPNNTGLRNDRKISGLEYIPAPVNGTNFDRDLTETNNGNHKNTARWRVGLNTGHAMFGGDFNNQQLTLETRLVHSDADPDERAADRNLPQNAVGANLNCPLAIVELCDGLWGDGDPYVPNNSSTGLDENKRDMRPNLYNVSRTYVYMNHAFTLQATDPANGTFLIPQVEQAQYLGHARYTPYADVKALHRYSQHWGGGNGNGFNNYDRAGGSSWNGVDSDMNWLFQLYSHGLMRSNAIYNSISGYSNYYHALGGELGTDGTNAVYAIRRQPWEETANAGTLNNSDNLINEITVTRRTIFSTSDTTPGGTDERWRLEAEQNDLFPDQDYQFWIDNGNLPNHSYTTAHNKSSVEPVNNRRFFRGQVGQGPHGLGGTRYRRLANSGSGAFLNGNPTGTLNRAADHSSTGGNALLNGEPGEAGRALVNAFNLTLPDSLTSDRPFTIDSGTTSGRYTDPEMSAIRNRLSYINSAAGTLHADPDNFNTYYRHSASSNVSSGMIKMTRNGNPALAGYVLMNGFANATGTGTMLMARMSQAGALQTFMDAGDVAVPAVAPGRAVQLPRIEITTPTAQRAYDDPNTISIEFETSWKRWDKEKYSPAYPDNWWESTELVYNLKYSLDNGRNWRYLDDEPVPQNLIDQYNPAKSLGIPVTLAQAAETHAPVTWDVSALSQGNYLLRAECYRAGFPEMGYAYHDVLVTISR